LSSARFARHAGVTACRASLIELPARESMTAATRVDWEPVEVATVAGAVVRAAIAPMLAEPHVSSGQVSQQLAGHVVSIVEDQGDWQLVRGRDDYEGWMHRGYLDRAARAVGSAGRISLGCIVRSESGARRALPLRALLAPGDEIEFGEVIHDADLPARFPRAADAIG